MKTLEARLFRYIVVILKSKDDKKGAKAILKMLNEEILKYLKK
jgi:hypothetical protein